MSYHKALMPVNLLDGGSNDWRAVYTSLRPLIALPTVISSVYSRSYPTGIP